MVLPSTQIAIGLLLIRIGIVITFDIKIDLFRGKSVKEKIWIYGEITISI